MDNRNIGIVGAGTMGKSIAKLFAGNNFNVLLVDCVDKSDEIENGIAFTMDFGRLAECDFIIETVFEEVNAKKKALESISKYGKADAIVASNTSSMSIDLLSGFVSNKKNFLGVHFFNPAHKMPLVEIVKGKETGAETVSFAKGIVETAGKKTVVLNDSPGFIVNALLFPFLVDSINMSEEKKISCFDMDLAVKCGLNHPLGPFALMDLIGLDTVYDIMVSLYKQTNDKKFKPPNVISKLVKEKKLGRKTGRGFYEY